jgi:hypothetical protein
MKILIMIETDSTHGVYWTLLLDPRAESSDPGSTSRSNHQDWPAPRDTGSDYGDRVNTTFSRSDIEG